MTTDDPMERRCPERLTGAAKRYVAAITARGATRTTAEWEAATPAFEDALQGLQEAVLDLDAVTWLAHVDD